MRFHSSATVEELHGYMKESQSSFARDLYDLAYSIADAMAYPSKGRRQTIIKELFRLSTEWGYEAHYRDLREGEVRTGDLTFGELTQLRATIGNLNSAAGTRKWARIIEDPERRIFMLAHIKLAANLFASSY